MNENEEQGFLSDKFQDWSGEPIPNGWFEIEKKLGHTKKRRPFFWLFLPAFIILGGLGYVALEKRNQENRLAGIQKQENGRAESFNAGSAKERTATISDGGKAGNESASSIEKTSAKIGEKPKAGLYDASNQDLKESRTNQKDASQLLSPSSAKSERIKTPVLASTMAQTDNEEDTKDANSETSPQSGRNKQDTSNRKFRKNKTIATLGGSTRQAVSGSISSDAIAASGDGSGTDVVSESVGNKGSKGKSRKWKAGVGREDQSKDNRLVNSGSSPLIREIPVSGSSNVENEQKTEVPFLALKSTLPHTASLPEGIPGIVEVVAPAATQVKDSELKPLSRWYYMVSVLGGGVQNTIFVRQAESQHNVKVKNLNQIQSNFVQASGSVQYAINPAFEAFSGLHLGVFTQVLSIQNTAKNPGGYGMEMHDSLNFSATPSWIQIDEKRTQRMIYSQTELGLKTFLLKSKKSGPFASLVLWTRLYEKDKTSFGQGAAFSKGASIASLGYRFGYQHFITSSLRIEAFMSSLQDGMLSKTKGISISQRLFGFGIGYKF